MKNHKNSAVYVIALIALIVLFLASVFVAPVFIILAVNTLFSLSIPITLGTWASVAWLWMILGSIFTVNLKK